jgi:hypothetical protein
MSAANAANFAMSQPRMLACIRAATPPAQDRHWRNVSLLLSSRSNSLT